MKGRLHSLGLTLFALTYSSVFALGVRSYLFEDGIRWKVGTGEFVYVIDLDSVEGLLRFDVTQFDLRPPLPAGQAWQRRQNQGIIHWGSGRVRGIHWDNSVTFSLRWGRRTGAPNPVTAPATPMTVPK